MSPTLPKIDKVQIVIYQRREAICTRPADRESAAALHDQPAYDNTSMNRLHTQITTKTIGFLAIALLLISISHSAAAGATRPQIVLTLGRPDGHPDARWTKLLFTEAFERLGIEFVYKFYPSKRGVAMADAGEVDGILSQPQEFGALHPNLIKVPASYVTLNYCAFAIDPAIQVDGWESLRGTGYRIDYLRGTDVAKIFLQELVRPEQLTELNDRRGGLKKLIAGRTDLFLDVEHTVLHELQTDAFKDAGIRHAGVLLVAPLYAYLHTSHADLVPKLTDVLKAMKTEGLVETYRVMAYGE